MDLSHAAWTKSVYSNDNGCVEIAYVDGQVAIRDSKNPGGPKLVFTPMEWTAFVNGVRDALFKPANKEPLVG